MAAKRFQPVLNLIPEEETYPSGGNSIDFYGLGSQRSGSIVSLKRENSRKRSVNCVGCPGCKFENSSELTNLNNFDNPTCTNCTKNIRGDKQNTIRKWLENIPTVKQQAVYNETNQSSLNHHNNSLINSLLSLPYIDKSKIRKQNSLIMSKHPMQYQGKRPSSTLSVRSEPLIRNYNIPLPDFDTDLHHNNYEHKNSHVDDVRMVGLTNYRSGSYRNRVVNQRKNKFITNKNALPDMVNDAIALEHSSKSYGHSSSDEERFYNKIPNRVTEVINVNNNLENTQNCNEYETDSLERASQKKGFSTPTEYGEVPSSQASPSLSNALPLEEELTIQNDVYKTNSSKSNTPSPNKEISITQNHYETIGETIQQKNIKKSNKNSNDYSLVSEVYVNNNYNFGSAPTSPSGSECSMGSRKKLNKGLIAKPGCLTIEVKDSPENYIKIHESDGFEPDTLDRKHQKHKEILDNIQFSRKDFIKYLNTNDASLPCQTIQLRSSGTFKKPNSHLGQNNEIKFCSLRLINENRQNHIDRPKLLDSTFSESKSLENKIDDTSDDNFDWNSEEGRILTLEMRHSKRQRQCTPPTIKQMKNLVRPDVLPPLPPTDNSPIYEQPMYPPRRVEMNHASTQVDTKNENGRSLSPRTFMNNTTINKLEASYNSFQNCRSSNGLGPSPLRASVHTQHSDYENSNSIGLYSNNDSKKIHDSFRQSSKKPFNRNSRGNISNNSINFNTYVKNSKDDNNVKSRFRRKKGGSAIEDSGYLSSDSTSSRQVNKKIVITKIVSCSESDDTENEARSESGGESVETNSVFFGSFRK